MELIKTSSRHLCLAWIFSLVLGVASSIYNNDSILPYEPSNLLQPTTADEESEATQRAKFFSPFSVVQFSNTMCSVGGRMGLCVTGYECTYVHGGSNMGGCANGFGTCCYKAIKCGESSSMNVTYIQNADYPSPTSDTGTCTHTIVRGDNVCNLRLDFDEFDLTDPFHAMNDATSGQCLDDTMTVSGVASTQFRYLCGKMPEVWHFYLDVRDASNPTTFTFNLANDNTKARKWNIKVTQIDCDRKIPRGCGQYFTGTTGDPLYSFNFGNNGIYLYGMNYGICFRQEKGYCTHTFVDNGPNSWVACTDSLAFPNAATSTTDLSDCNVIGVATVWPSPMTTNNFSPTIIYHYTDQENALRDLGALTPTPGFCFTWQANAC